MITPTRLLLYFTVAFVSMSIILHTAQAQQTSRGRDFYVSFMPNFHANSANTDSVTIFVVAEKPTTGTIRYRTPFNNDTVVSFTIADPNVIYQFSRIWRNHELFGVNNSGTFSFMNNDNEKPIRKSFRIQTDSDVAVYALNIASLTTDATLVLPVPALGKEYFVLSYNADGVLTDVSTRNGQYTPSQLCVVATEDNTTVNIVPSAPTTETGLATKSITLNAGEVFLLQTDVSLTNLRYDLSGSYINASSPIAVFSGQQRALVPVSQRGTLSSRDHLFEQLIPTNVCGKSFIITPFQEPVGSTSTSGSDLFRVVAIENNTVVQFRQTVVATLNRGQVYEAPLTQAGLLRASRKVMVALYRRTSGDGRGRQSGDPFMMIIPPRSQYLTKYRFQNCNTDIAFTEQYITLITTRQNIPTIRLDGQPVPNRFTDVPGTCYVFANIPTTDGAHTLTSSKFVGLYVYGYGEANSYGYVGGMAFNPDIEDVFVSAGNDQSICIGDSAVLSASGNYVTLNWSELRSGRKLTPCDTCPSVTVRPSTSNEYLLVALDSLGCEVRDTVQVIVNEIPTVNAEPDTVVCSDSPIVLRATGQYQSVQWSPSIGLSCTLCSNTLLTPTQDMTYFVTVRNGNSERCTARDSVRIKYVNGVHSQLPPKISVCSGDSITLALNYNGRVRWTPANLFPCDTCKTVTIKPKGNVKITATGDSANCTTSATSDITIVTKAEFIPLRDTTICKGQTLTLTVNTTSNDIAWSPSDFLNCITCKTVTLIPDVSIQYTVRIGSPQSQCSVLDTVKVNVVNRPDVSVRPHDTSVCIGTSVQINADVPDSVKVRWSPTVGLSCDTCKRPVFISSAAGVYTYYLTVFSDSLCTRIDSVTIRIADYPTLSLNTNATSVCRGSQVTLSAQTDGFIRWKPASRLGCDTCTTNTFTPDSTRTYYATVRNTSGCEVSDSIIIRVYDMPFGLLDKKKVDLCVGRSETVTLTNIQKVASIRWQPATYLDCDTCRSVRITPLQSTTYIVTLTSPDNCIITDTVQVNVVPCNRMLNINRDVNLGDVLACDTAYRYLTPDVTGSNTTVTVNSISIVPGSLAKVIGLDSIALPDSLQPNQKRTYPLIIIPPPVIDTFSVQLIVRSNATDSIQTITLRGKSVQRPVTAEVLSVSSSLGENIQIPVKVSSEYWTALDITKIELRLKVLKSQLDPLRSIQINEQLKGTWTATYQRTDVSGDTNITTYLLEGKSPITADVNIAFVGFTTLITTIFSYPVTVDISFPDRPVDCIEELSIGALMPVVGCAKEIRAVKISGTAFGLKAVSPNPIHQTDLSIRFGVGYDAPLKLEMIDGMGRVVKTIADGMLKEGEYELIANTSPLSNGVYFVRYSVAGMVFVQQLSIIR
ncbi:MAG: IgGFc-binding protein [Candidatus Kapabacteria bacterium]|nr:IgGFc-binding protein [Candidatus Kapabacteria bacterium]